MRRLWNGGDTAIATPEQHSKLFALGCDSQGSPGSQHCSDHISTGAVAQGFTVVDGFPALWECGDVAVYKTCVTQPPPSPALGSWRICSSVAFQAVSRLKNVPSRGTEPWRTNCSLFRLAVVSAVLGSSLWSSRVESWPLMLCVWGATSIRESQNH